jgi:STAS domain
MSFDWRCAVGDGKGCVVRAYIKVAQLKDSVVIHLVLAIACNTTDAVTASSHHTALLCLLLLLLLLLSLQDYFGELLSERVTARPGLHTIIIDASSINDIDPTAVRSLLALTKHYQLDGVATFFANWKGECLLWFYNATSVTVVCYAAYHCVVYRTMRSTAVTGSQ